MNSAFIFIHLHKLKCSQRFKVSFLNKTAFFPFSETVTNPHENLPLVFENTEDPSINNLTRNDINCDKTGTCYDGKLKY